GHVLHAVGGAGQGHQLDLDPVLLEPAEPGRHRERRGGGGDRAGAPADLEVGDLGGRRPGEQGGRQDGAQPPGGAYHAPTSFSMRGSRARPGAPPSISSRPCSAFGFSEGSQKRTRRRTSKMARFRTRPRSDRTSRTENCPETSIVKFMLWMSMPSPALAP